MKKTRKLYKNLLIFLSLCFFVLGASFLIFDTKNNTKTYAEEEVKTIFSNTTGGITVYDPFYNYVPMSGVTYNADWGGLAKNKIDKVNEVKNIHLYSSPHGAIPHYSIVNLNFNNPVKASELKSLTLKIKANFPADYGNSDYFHRLYAVNENGMLTDSSKYIDLEGVSRDGTYHELVLGQDELVNLANSDGYIKIIQYNGHFTSGTYSMGEHGYYIEEISYVTTNDAVGYIYNKNVAPANVEFSDPFNSVSYVAQGSASYNEGWGGMAKNGFDANGNLHLYANSHDAVPHLSIVNLKLDTPVKATSIKTLTMQVSTNFLSYALGDYFNRLYAVNSDGKLTDASKFVSLDGIPHDAETHTIELTGQQISALTNSDGYIDTLQFNGHYQSGDFYPECGYYIQSITYTEDTEEYAYKQYFDNVTLSDPLASYVPMSGVSYVADWGGLAKNRIDGGGNIILYSAPHGSIPHYSIVNMNFSNPVKASDLKYLVIKITARFPATYNNAGSNANFFHRLYAVNDNGLLTNSAEYIDLEGIPHEDAFHEIVLYPEDLMKLANVDGYIKTIQYNGHFTSGDYDMFNFGYFIERISYETNGGVNGYLYNKNESGASVTLSDPFTGNYDNARNNLIVGMENTTYSDGWGGTAKNKIQDGKIHLYSSPNGSIPHYSVIDINLKEPLLAESIKTMSLTIGTNFVGYEQDSSKFFHRLYAVNSDGTLTNASKFINLETVPRDGQKHTIELTKEQISALTNSDGYIKTIQYNGQFKAGDFYDECGYNIYEITYTQATIATPSQKTLYKNQINNYLKTTEYNESEATRVAEIKAKYCAEIDSLTYLDAIKLIPDIAKAEIDLVATKEEADAFGTFDSLGSWGFVDYATTGNATLNDGSWTAGGIYNTPHQAGARTSGSIDLLIDFSTFTKATCLRFNVDVFSAVIYNDRIELDRWLGQRDTIVKTIYYGKTLTGIERIAISSIYDDSNAPYRTVKIIADGVSYYYYGAFSDYQGFQCGLTAYDGNIKFTTPTFYNYANAFDTTPYSGNCLSVLQSYISKAQSLTLPESEYLLMKDVPTTVQFNDAIAEITNYLVSETYDTVEGDKVEEIRTTTLNAINASTNYTDIKAYVKKAKSSMDLFATASEKATFGTFDSLDTWGFSSLNYDATGSITINDGSWTVDGIYTVAHSSGARNSGSIELLVDFSTFTSATCLRFNVDVFSAVIYNDRIELDRWLGQRNTIITTIYYGKTLTGAEKIDISSDFDNATTNYRTVKVVVDGISYFYYGAFDTNQSFPCGLTAWDGDVKLTSTKFIEYASTLDSSLYSGANKTLIESYIEQANSWTLSYNELLYAKAIPTTEQVNLHLNATAGTDARTNRPILGIEDIREYNLKDSDGNSYNYLNLEYNKKYTSYYKNSSAKSNYISGGIRFVIDFGEGMDTTGDAKQSGLIWRFCDVQLKLYGDHFAICRYDSDEYWSEYASTPLRATYTGEQVVVISLVADATNNIKNVYLSIGDDEYHIVYHSSEFYGQEAYLLWQGKGEGSDALSVSSTKNPLIIDGVEYFVSMGDEISLVEKVKAGLLHLGWENDGKLYSPNYSFIYDGINSLDFEPVYIDLFILDGASIKATLDVTGIRFTTVLSDTNIDILTGKVEDFGIIILPKDLIVGELTVDSSNIAKVDFDFEVGSKCAVIKEIRSSNYNREFCARGFLQVDFEDGLQYVYTSVTTRSVYDVALRALELYPETLLEEACSSFVNGVIDIDLFGGSKFDRNFNTEYTIDSVVENSTNNFTVTVSTSNPNVKAVSINGIPLRNGTSFAGITFTNLSISDFSDSGYTINFSLGYYDKTGAIQYLDTLADIYELGTKAYVESLVATAKSGVNGANSASEILRILGTLRQDIADLRRADVAPSYGTKLDTPAIVKNGPIISWSAVANADYYVVYDSGKESVLILDKNTLSYTSEIVGLNTVKVSAYSYYLAFAPSDIAVKTVEVTPAMSYNAVNTGRYELSKSQITTLSGGIYNESGLYFYNENDGWTTDGAKVTSYALPGDKNADPSSDEYKQYLRTKQYFQNYKNAGNNILIFGDKAGFCITDGVVGGYYTDTETYLKVLDIAWEVGLKVVVFDNLIFNVAQDCYYTAFVDNGIDSIGNIGTYDDQQPVNNRVTLNPNGKAKLDSIINSLSQYIKHPAFYGVTIGDEPYDGYNGSGRYAGQNVNGHEITKYESRQMEVIGVVYNWIKDYCNKENVDCHILCCLFGSVISANVPNDFTYYNYICHYLDCTGADEFAIDAYVGNIYSTGDFVDGAQMIVSYNIATQVAKDRNVKFNAVSTAWSISTSGDHALRGSDVMFNAFYAMANGSNERIYFCYSPVNWQEAIYNTMVGYKGETNGVGYLYVDRVNDSLNLVEGMLDGLTFTGGEFVNENGSTVQLQYRTNDNNNNILTSATLSSICCYKGTFTDGTKTVTVYVPMKDDCNFNITVSGTENYRFNLDGEYYNSVSGRIALSYGQCLISIN